MPRVASVVVDDKEWLIAPLNLGMLREHSEAAELVASHEGAMLNKRFLDALAELLIVSLQKNHPEITQIVVNDLVDVTNANQFVAALMGASGFRRGNRLGEDPAAPGDGTNSTASSPPPSDTGPEISTN